MKKFPNIFKKIASKLRKFLDFPAKKCELCGKSIKAGGYISFVGHLGLGYGAHKYSCADCYEEYIVLREREHGGPRKGK